VADQIRLVLASASPARLRTLRTAGLHPEVIVSGVDESVYLGLPPASLVSTLAERKAAAVADRLEPTTGERLLVIGCDSVLELDGIGCGKPTNAATAVARWQAMRGRSGVLHTGHCVVDKHGSTVGTWSALASTIVHFARVNDSEIQAYVATGEPLEVAGGFTIDGLGAAFITGIDGDPHNVVGISLPLLRTMLAELGISWPSLWAAPPGHR
jgi:nucleoside triphosphate pyrophosphatase